ncbi:LysR substrate-binding domain-containing protein [Sphingomonas sp. G-3-2-10]|uniref:LysR substrate-binding domain-containing protein n=1 Tax=Sphingomonas sp. G-3-2-10 TaxID=2728838 RepID=UPI00146ADF15|nr:LysR substrate-binding domain-containing protein [Sphingomonas sp. G-3-2-10]NML05890.1 LysR family transcriptional regulator [Sphingomonas sp. G-3-2-10]
MNEALPSLTALKVFASCARNRSFTRAADELGITPGAVTQHIRALELWAGTPLFRRTGRSVLLTTKAEAALPLLTEGFGQISQGAGLLRFEDEQAHVVNVVAPPTFAAKWLLTRLDGFRRDYPEFDVWVSVDAQGPRGGKAQSDVYIRYGLDAGDESIAEPLVHDEVVPVASPEFVERYGLGNGPTGLIAAPLLHYVSDKIDPSFPDWPAWFQAHGIASPLESTRGSRFDHPGLLIDQAVSGRGAALAKRILATPDIISGRLVQLFGDRTPVRSAYWISRPRGRTLRPPVQAFIDWIRTDVRTACPELH